MASIGSLILQNPYHWNIHIEIVQITESTLEIDDKIYDILDIAIEGKYLWYDQLVKFLRDGFLPKDFTKLPMKAFKLWAFHYYMLGDILYQRGFDGILLCFFRMGWFINCNYIYTWWNMRRTF